MLCVYIWDKHDKSGGEDGPCTDSSVESGKNVDNQMLPQAMVTKEYND